MKVKILILGFLYFFSLNPIFAFIKIGKPKKPKTDIYLKENFLIEKNIVIDGEQDTLRIGYALIPNQDEIIISVVYDELLQKPITKVTWEIENLNPKKKNKQTFSSTKNQQTILKQIEEMAQTLDPKSAYDRIIYDKHLIKKDFYFKKSEIFDLTKPIIEQKHTLEISFINNQKNINYPLDISSEIYFKQFISTQAPKQAKTQPSKPIQAPQKSQTSSPNFGNAKVPGYLFPQRSSIQPTQQSEGQLNPSQMLELKELEEARMKLKGVDELFQNTIQNQEQNPSNSNADLENLKRLMESESTGLEESGELF